MTTIKTLEQESCDDAISRQAVLDYIYNDLRLGDEEYGNDVERQMELERSYKYVKSLSPVAPQQKTGHWISVSYGYYCSECDQYYPCVSYWDYKFHYCPNCDAKMVEPQVSKVNNKEVNKT